MLGGGGGIEWVTIMCKSCLVLVFALLAVQKAKFETLWECKTPRCKITWKRDFQTYHVCFWVFEIRPKFSETHIFEKPFYTACSEDLEKKNACSAGYIWKYTLLQVKTNEKDTVQDWSILHFMQFSFDLSWILPEVYPLRFSLV